MCEREALEAFFKLQKKTNDSKMQQHKKKKTARKIQSNTGPLKTLFAIKNFKQP